MKIAIEGCCHGELDKIYSTIEYLQAENNFKIDLLIICGDFQAIRNEKDLDSMAVPDKYKQMQTFWKYYAGIKTAPVLTLFIGGNHEASNFLCELPYGGWVAPKIYYTGYANVINFAGIRIGGLSGIYKPQDFHKGHYEIPPFNPGTNHSVYHVRNLETFRLSQLKKPLDIMLTHDWPLGVYHHGNVQQLVKFKPYFADEIQNNTLGSSQNEKLLKLLKPKYWFSAHLHVKFACVYKHSVHDETSDLTTKFLSLDKCLPNKRFLQVIDLEGKESAKKCLSLDEEWLCILKKSDHLLSIESYSQAPISLKENLKITEEDLNEVREDFQNCFEIPENFEKTAPAYQTPEADGTIQNIYLNEQTTLYLEMLTLRDPIRMILEKKGKSSLVSESNTEMYNKLLDESDEEEKDN